MKTTFLEKKKALLENTLRFTNADALIDIKFYDALEMLKKEYDDQEQDIRMSMSQIDYLLHHLASVDEKQIMINGIQQSGRLAKKALENRLKTLYTISDLLISMRKNTLSDLLYCVRIPSLLFEAITEDRKGFLPTGDRKRAEEALHLISRMHEHIIARITKEIGNQRDIATLKNLASDLLNGAQTRRQLETIEETIAANIPNYRTHDINYFLRDLYQFLSESSKHINIVLKGHDEIIAIEQQIGKKIEETEKKISILSEKTDHLKKPDKKWVTNSEKKTQSNLAHEREVFGAALETLKEAYHKKDKERVKTIEKDLSLDKSTISILKDNLMENKKKWAAIVALLFASWQLNNHFNPNEIPNQEQSPPSISESIPKEILSPHLPNPPKLRPLDLPNLPEKKKALPPFSDIILQSAKKHNVDPYLIAALIKTESHWDIRAESRTGAQGLMQLMPPTAASLGVKDSFDPAENIEGGTKYLRKLLERYGHDVDIAIAAYNAGPTNVDKYKGIPPFKETIRHVKKVKHNYAEMKIKYPDLKK